MLYKDFLIYKNENAVLSQKTHKKGVDFVACQSKPHFQKLKVAFRQIFCFFEKKLKILKNHKPKD